jgi:hypothetical protein
MLDNDLGSVADMFDGRRDVRRAGAELGASRSCLDDGTDVVGFGGRTL